MEKGKIRVVLDTNILISALMFGGRPRKVLEMVIEKKMHGITSAALLVELTEVLSKKFGYELERVRLVEGKIRKAFRVVQPKVSLQVVRDDDDNRVVEAAVEGRCKVIVTGDKELLKVGRYKGVKILTAEEFLNYGSMGPR